MKGLKTETTLQRRKSDEKISPPSNFSSPDQHAWLCLKISRVTHKRTYRFKKDKLYVFGTRKNSWEYYWWHFIGDKISLKNRIFAILTIFGLLLNCLQNCSLVCLKPNLCRPRLFSSPHPHMSVYFNFFAVFSKTVRNIYQNFHPVVPQYKATLPMIPNLRKKLSRKKATKN